MLIVNLFASDDHAFLYLALVSSFVALLNLVIQLWVLCDFSIRIFIKSYLHFVTIFRIIIASICMVLVLKSFNLSDSYWITLSMFDRLKSIALIVCAGVFVYSVIMIILGGLRSFRELRQ